MAYTIELDRDEVKTAIMKYLASNSQYPKILDIIFKMNGTIDVVCKSGT